MEKNIDIPPFYISQEIVAIRDHSQGAFKKGDEFKVTSIGKSCCTWIITIGIKATGVPVCTLCGKYRKYTGEWEFRTDSFAPKVQLGEFVSMKEVVQLETVCAN